MCHMLFPTPMNGVFSTCELRMIEMMKMKNEDLKV